MDNYQGDLADMIRATVDGATAPTNWQFPTNTIQYSSDPVDDFGDPFSCIMGDPLMQINNIDSSQSGFLYNSTAVRTAGELAGVNSASHKVVNVDDDHMIRRPPNIFSRMLQISPNEKFGVAPPCDSTAAPLGLKCNRPPAESRGIQISSPRNTGIKRRKSQAKKVVCIPAPAPANSRATGEVVPSDLWAWRKYGQKPIKGSPYPRGYYRCSSSKGCSARKQVERSRTDSNMLVITYTSEHNHPWPTQRNALAGSTRSQPSKNTKNKSQNSDPQKPTNSKQDPKDIRPENPQTSSPGDDDPALVKEETDQDFDNIMEDSEFDDGLPQTLYKPTMVDSDSFFADLDEINEADPLDLLFGQGFSRSDDSGCGNGDLDPFSFYDWATCAVDGGAGGGSAATPHRG